MNNQNAVELGLKKCSKCKELKSCTEENNEFYIKNGKLSSQCKDCMRESSRNWKAANRDRMDEYNQQYYTENYDRELTRAKEYRDANKDKVKIAQKRWYDKNRKYRNEYCAMWKEDNCDSVSEYNKEYCKKNPHITSYKQNKRRAAFINAIPEWADFDKIKEIYRQARYLESIDGIPRHVDHIIPLQHELVCGLHVENNLQILTAKENVKKRDKFKPIIESFS